MNKSIFSVIFASLSVLLILQSCSISNSHTKRTPRKLKKPILNNYYQTKSLRHSNKNNDIDKNTIQNISYDNSSGNNSTSEAPKDEEVKSLSKASRSTPVSDNILANSSTEIDYLNLTSSVNNDDVYHEKSNYSSHSSVSVQKEITSLKDSIKANDHSKKVSKNKKETKAKNKWRNFLLNFIVPGLGTFLSGEKLLGVLQFALFIGGIIGAYFLFWYTSIYLIYPFTLSGLALLWALFTTYPIDSKTDFGVPKQEILTEENNNAKSSTLFSKLKEKRTYDKEEKKNNNVDNKKSNTKNISDGFEFKTPEDRYNYEYQKYTKAMYLNFRKALKCVVWLSACLLVCYIGAFIYYGFAYYGGPSGAGLFEELIAGAPTIIFIGIVAALIGAFIFYLSRGIRNYKLRKRLKLEFQIREELKNEMKND